MIHHTAIIDSTAIIDESASIGAYATVQANAVIGANCVIENHAIVGENTTLGKNNRIFPFSAIGLETQDKKIVKGQSTYLYIGDNNIFREYCTVNRGTNDKSGGKTIIGSNNLFLAYTHVAHDCILGDDIVMSNNATVGGHVKVGSKAIISAFVAVQQFCHIGDYAFIGLGGMITRDIPTYAITINNPSKVHGANIIGLKRNHFSEENIRLIVKAYALLYPRHSKRQGNVVDIIKQIEQFTDKDGVLVPFLQFLKTGKSKQGLCS